MIGSCIIFLKFKNIDNIINLSLSFAVGVMISVSIFDLIPESYNLFIGETIPIVKLLISINIGIIISMLLNKLINIEDNLYRVGVISMVAIIIHNIPEGIVTYISTTHDIRLGMSLTIAIALHNIPEGISIALPIYCSTQSKKRALLYTLLSSVTEIVGALLAKLVLINRISDLSMAAILGCVSGIMLYISIYELLPQTKKYNNFKKTIISILIGGVIMILSIILIK